MKRRKLEMRLRQYSQIVLLETNDIIVNVHVDGVAE